MSIALVEAVVFATGASPKTVTFGTATTAGELIVVVYSAVNSAQASTITDNAGGGSSSYTKAFEVTGISASHANCGLAYAFNVAAGITQVTVTAPSQLVTMIVGHYTGCSATSPVDQNSGNPSAGGAGSPWTSGTVTTQQANELLIGHCFGFEATGSVTFGATGSWTLEKTLSDGNGNGLSYNDQIVSSIQTNIANTGTIATGTVSNTYASIVTFTAIGGDVVTEQNQWQIVVS